MRVPACAMLGLLTLDACADNASERPLLAAPEGCGRAEVPADLDARAGRWQLVAPRHAVNEFGVAQRVFGLLDACESFVSLSHSTGHGGKASSNGPSELLISAYGEAWAKHAFGVGNSFRDIVHGGKKWVAVGHGDGSPGAIAVADSLNTTAWREVFQSDGFYFNSVAYGANTFVAVTNNGVATSRDGEQWSWANVPGPAQYFEVAFGGGHFVIAGVGAALTSTDGQTWSELRCEDASMCQPPRPPPAVSACSPGAACPSDGNNTPAVDYLALQSVRYVDKKFYAFGGSGALVSSDALTFRRVAELPDAAMGGVLLRMANAPEPGSLPTSVFASEDAGNSWFELPVAEAQTVDCREVPCVAVPQGILAFVAP